MFRDNGMKRRLCFEDEKEHRQLEGASEPNPKSRELKASIPREPRHEHNQKSPSRCVSSFQCVVAPKELRRLERSCLQKGASVDEVLNSKKARDGVVAVQGPCGKVRQRPSSRTLMDVHAGSR